MLRLILNNLETFMYLWIYFVYLEILLKNKDFNYYKNVTIDFPHNGEVQV